MASVSRYRRGEVDPVTGLRLPQPATAVVTHTVTDGDRLDSLADRYYRDSRTWWRIGDANPDLPWPPDLVGQGPHATVRVGITTPGRWPEVLPSLLADPGIVRAHLAEPPATAPTPGPDAPAVAVVVHHRFTRTADEVADLLERLGLGRGGHTVVGAVGTEIAVPPAVGG